MRSEIIDDLPLVMHEVAEAMAAKWCALSMHPTLDARPVMLFADPEITQLEPDLLLDLANQHLSAPADAEPWHHEQSSAFTLFHIRVNPIPGHARLVITLVFDHPSDEQRRWAEAMYQTRKPFAVGYFRLWQTSRNLERHVGQLEAVLDMTEIAVLLLDREGELRFSNDTANAILDAENGLRRRGGSIRATHMADAVGLQIALEHVMRDSAAPSGHGRIAAPVLALRRKAGSPLIAAVLPTQTAAVEPSDVAAIVYIVDPRQDITRMLMPLCRLYHLSPTESILVSHLVAGRTISELAATMRIKDQTARGYLRQVFIKTSTSRQTELIVLMLSSLVRMKEEIAQEAVDVSRLEPTGLGSVSHAALRKSSG